METWRENAQPGQTHDPNEVTVQLDGIGRQLGELRPSGHRRPRGGASSDAPVFVDESGRRGRTLRRLGVLVGLLCAGYAAVILATLLSGNSDAPWLPVPDADAGKPAGRVDTPPLPGDSGAPAAGVSAAPDALPGGTGPADTASGPAAPAAPAASAPGKNDSGTRPATSGAATPGTGSTPGGGHTGSAGPSAPQPPAATDPADPEPPGDTPPEDPPAGGEAPVSAVEGARQ